jgi:hypothetical protein
MNRHAMFVLVPAALNGDPRSMTLNELLRDKEPISMPTVACVVKNASKTLGKS